MIIAQLMSYANADVKPNLDTPFYPCIPTQFHCDFLLND